MLLLKGSALSPVPEGKHLCFVSTLGLSFRAVPVVAKGHDPVVFAANKLALSRNGAIIPALGGVHSCLRRA